MTRDSLVGGSSSAAAGYGDDGGATLTSTTDDEDAELQELKASFDSLLANLVGATYLTTGEVKEAIKSFEEGMIERLSIKSIPVQDKFVLHAVGKINELDESGQSLEHKNLFRNKVLEWQLKIRKKHSAFAQQQTERTAQEAAQQLEIIENKLNLAKKKKLLAVRKAEEAAKKAAGESQRAAMEERLAEILAGQKVKEEQSLIEAKNRAKEAAEESQRAAMEAELAAKEVEEAVLEEKNLKSDEKILILIPDLMAKAFHEKLQEEGQGGLDVKLEAFFNDEEKLLVRVAVGDSNMIPGAEKELEKALDVVSAINVLFNPNDTTEVGVEKYHVCNKENCFDLLESLQGTTFGKGFWQDKIEKFHKDLDHDQQERVARKPFLGDFVEKSRDNMSVQDEDVTIRRLMCCAFDLWNRKFEKDIRAKFKGNLPFCLVRKETELTFIIEIKQDYSYYLALHRKTGEKGEEGQGEEEQKVMEEIDNITLALHEIFRQPYSESKGQKFAFRTENFRSLVKLLEEAETVSKTPEATAVLGVSGAVAADSSTTPSAAEVRGASGAAAAVRKPFRDRGGGGSGGGED